jgi:hypothetical protein
MVNLGRLARFDRFVLCLGVAWLLMGVSGCMPFLVGMAALPLAAAALELTHPVDGTASYMVWEKEERTEATTVCSANGAPPDSDCVSYEMPAKR